MNGQSKGDASNRVPTNAPALGSSRPARLPMWLADQLEEGLLGGAHPVGTRMATEKVIAEDYGVSRQVVREAARLLEGRGLVEIKAGRGMTVVEPNVDTIVARFRLLLRRGDASFEQLMELRQMVEVDMAAVAALKRTPADVEQLWLIIAQARRDITAYSACLDADLAFHLAVARATQNPLVLGFVQPINIVLRDVYHKPIGYLATQPNTLAEHTAIAQAIADGDAEAARLSSSQHLERVLGDAARLVDGEYTTDVIALPGA